MEPIILPHGGYQKLESYQNSIIIFDATNDFCTLFLKKGDRTVDQMIQAARSGKQNIVEGCEASGISTETEIKLLGVARASLEELLEDYRDHLRTHEFPLWEKDDKRVLEIRRLAKLKNRSYMTYKSCMLFSCVITATFLFREWALELVGGKGKSCRKGRHVLW